MDARAVMEDEGRLRLAWVLRLRQATLVACLGIALTSALLDPSSTQAALAVVVAGALSHVVVRAVLVRRPRVHDGAIAAAIVVDIVVLTALLATTAGPMNPFTLLYVVHVATASVALQRRLAGGVAVFAAAAYGVLFAPGLVDEGALMEHLHSAGFALHTRGMWVAFSLTAAFIVVFVGRLREVLEERDQRVAELRAAAERAQRLASLATLAGGAAHELATPLSTIAVVAGELRHRFADHADAGVREDLALLLSEVERCRVVLQQLAVDAGTPGGEAPTLFPLVALIDEALSELPMNAASARVRVLRSPRADEAQVRGPRRALATALRGLVKNALQADAGVIDVDVDANGSGAGARVTVRDHGPGMSADVLARVGEPFFTTKEPGSGMGLGVFLARAVIEGCGGRLTLTSTPGAGTRVVVDLPLSREGAPP